MRQLIALLLCVFTGSCFAQTLQTVTTNGSTTNVLTTFSNGVNVTGGQIKRSGLSPAYNPTLMGNLTGFVPDIGLYDSNNGATGGMTLLNNGYTVGLGITSYDRLISSYVGTTTYKTFQLHSATTNASNYGLYSRSNGATGSTGFWGDRPNTNSIYSMNAPLHIGTYGAADVKIFAAEYSDPNIVPAITIKGNTQNIGINTVPSTIYKLAVNGDVVATKMVVRAIGWADYVFKPNYELPPLSKVAHFIKENGHLQDIPTEKEVIEHGIDLGGMHVKLLKKVEELTLYLIQQQQLIEKQQKQIDALEKRIKD